MMLGDTASGTMGGGGVGAVKTGEEGVCKAVCQKSSRSKLGDFFGYHRSAIKGRRSGCFNGIGGDFSLEFGEEEINCGRS